MASSHLRETLNRRARSLALLRPLFDVEANKGRHSGLGIERLDLFRLLSAILDVIITEMGGFQRGATYEQIMDAVMGQFGRLDDQVDELNEDRITSFLLDALTNEKERDSFRAQYQHETAEGQLVWSPLIFKLVELRDLDASGEGRYVASAEAINIYLSSLNVELEGQQAADEAALRHFIEHGKLDEAELAARAALMRTIEYADRIRRALQLIERGVGELDWVGDMLPKLDAARNHIEERMRAEESLIIDAERKLEEADISGKRRLTVVIEQLDGASTHHNALLNLILGANRRFMDEHARQRFRPATLNPFPNPQSAILRPLLRQSLGSFDDWLKESWYLLHPPEAYPLADFSLTARLLMRPKRDVESSGEVVEGEELEEGRDVEPPFSEETWETFEATFRRMPGQFRLSHCLQELPHDTDVPLLAVLLAGQWFEGRADDPAAERCDGSFSCGSYYGDDLTVTKPA